MKLVIQRVLHAAVTVDETKELVGKIDEGLFILVGFKKGDTEPDVLSLTSKLLKLRVMGDESKKMNLSVKDANAEILVVSQFTLYANTKDGNRPSFVESLDPESAKKLYLLFIEKLKAGGSRVSSGSFGNYMNIETKLDGPVTIIIES